MDMASAESAFPKLSGDEMQIVRSMARREEFGDGDVVFRAGDADIDFFVVKSGQVEILNPTRTTRASRSTSPASSSATSTCSRAGR